VVSLEQVLPVIFGLAAVVYLGMSAFVFQNTDDRANDSISYLLVLIGAFVAGASLWYGATDMNLFRIGRVLTMFAAGFMPVAFYMLYREYAGDRPSGQLIAALAIIPSVTTALAITNPWHGLLWEAQLIAGSVQFSHVREHAWFRLVSLPFVSSLFGYSLLALAGRLTTLARAHRWRVAILLVCAVMPFVVNVANTLLDVGPYEFPFTATTLVLLLPFYWWAAIRLRVATFKPVAYQTLFDHVQDAILVLDNDRDIVSVNRRGEELLDSTESDLIGRSIDEVSEDIGRQLRYAGEACLSSTISFDGKSFLARISHRCNGNRPLSGA